MLVQRLRLAACVVAVGAIGSTSSCNRSQRPDRAWRVLFGPVISSELIVGHVIAGSTAWILTGADALVRLDLTARHHVRTVVRPLAEGEHVWGLATVQPADGLWTLVGRSVLARLSSDGSLARRIDLEQPHVGVFSGGHRLVYQVMNFQPPVDALMAGPPGEEPRTAWSRMRTRALPLTRTAVAALNLVSCGSTANGTIPCWFPDQAAITLTEPSGTSREVVLEGLPLVAPEILLASDNPRRPIRDAFVSSTGELWVLSSGEPPQTEDPIRPGGWLLARYEAATGRLLLRTRLPEPARVLLGATGGRCLLLAWDGRVVETEP